MESPVIFISTPRAGKLNHRYLAPSLAMSDAELSAIEHSTSPHILRVELDVVQADGIRIGKESLILKHPLLSRLTESHRAQIRRVLEQKLSAIDKLAQEAGTAGSGHGMVVACPELARWQEDFERLIGQSTDLCRGLFLLRGILVLGVALAGILLIVWFANGSGSHPKPSSTGARSAGTDSSDKSDNRDTWLPTLAKVLSVRNPGSSDELHRLVNNQLQTLFESKNSLSNVAATETTASLMLEFYRHAFGKTQVSDLSDIVDDQSVQDRLRCLFPKGKLDPNALLGESDIEGELRRIDARAFYRLATILGELAKSEVENNDVWSQYAKVFSAARDTVDNLERNGATGLTPQFYGADAKKKAVRIQEFLESINRAGLLEANETGLRSVISSAGAKFQDLGHPLSEHSLRSVRDESTRRRHNLVADAFSRLSEFMSACQEISRESMEFKDGLVE